MVYIPKIRDYLKILTDEKVKDSVVINFSKYFISIREEENSRKAFKLLYTFLTTSDKVKSTVQSNAQLSSSDNCIHCYNVEILNIFNSELQLININNQIKRIAK